MAIKISTIDEAIVDNGLKVLVYGLLGSGKTRLCATAASAESPVLIINAEGGLRSLKHLDEDQKKHITVAKMENFSDLYEIHTWLCEEHRFNWVCLDSISEIAEVVLANEKQAVNDPRAAYGNLADTMFDLLRHFRDLPHYNVYMSAKMTRFTDEITNRTSYWPLMPGKQLTNGIGYLFDEVWALRVEDGENGQERWLQTARDIQYEAKDRSGVLDPFEPADLTYCLNKINNDSPAVPAEDHGTENDNGTDD